MKFKENFLICLTGLPASGKSTFAKLLKKKILSKQNQFDVDIIDPDVIRSSITDNSFDPKKEELVRRKNLNEIEFSLKQKRIVISDDINYYTSMRHELKEIAKRFDISFFIIYISTPLNTCLNWNERRGTPIPNKVILKIAKRFDSFEKYKWEKPDLIIDLSEIDDINPIIDEFLEYINIKLKRDSFLGKKKKADKSRQKNYNEKLDSFTREVVGEILSQKELQNKKDEILQKRKEFIQNNLDDDLTQMEIKKNFKKFLGKTLDLDII